MILWEDCLRFVPFNIFFLSNFGENPSLSALRLVECRSMVVYAWHASYFFGRETACSQGMVKIIEVKFVPTPIIVE